MIRIFAILALMNAALATTVEFQLAMAAAEQNALFDADADTVCVHGDWNSWSAAALAEGPDSLYHATLEIAQGYHEYKYVIHSSQGLLWEEGENRSFTAQGLSQQLSTVWFNRDSLICPPQAVEALWTANLSTARITGQFDPELQWLTVRAAHPELGAWGPGPHFEHLQGDYYQLELNLDSLGGAALPWKLVLEDRNDPENLVWESGEDRQLQRSCDEVDADGDSFLELPDLQLRFGSTGGQTETEDLLLGLDNSWGPQMEHAGAVWSDSLGQEATAEAVYHRHGFNLLRLRLWHTPEEAWQGLDSTLAHALRAKNQGFEILLDLHYSDTWADPGQQTPPAAWQGLDAAILADSVEGYTADVLDAFAAAGCLPEYLQLGNEINGGMLWPTGSVQEDTPAQWTQLSELLLHAMAGVDAVCSEETRPELLLHLAAGGQNALVRHYLDSLDPACQFDMLALSWYPWWHGDTEALASNLGDLATRYGLPLLIVEHAYPFSLGWWDDCNNIVGLEEQLLPGYAATPAGQAQLAVDLLQIVRDLPNGLGRGLCFWEPAVLASALCTGHENLSHFDALGQGLPVLDCLQGLAPAAPQIQIVVQGGFLRLHWEAVPGVSAYSLESAQACDGPWTEVHTFTGNELLLPIGETLGFYRVRSLQ